jgi:tetratricopeptide (TPR) repeat protein
MLVVIFVGLTLLQNQVWENQFSLYSNTLKYEDGTDRVHNNIALAYLSKNETRLAKEHLFKALEINPYNIHVHYNLGRIFYDKGELEKSIYYFNASVKINPRFSAGFRQMGDVYSIMGELDKANENYVLAERSQFY